ncbi:unnamed protein product [Sympodiomycopsis kandeliae]
MSAAGIPAECAQVALQVQEKTTVAFVSKINEALPIVFLIWLSFGTWIGDWTNSWADEWALTKRGFTPAGISYFLARIGGGLGLLCYAITTTIGGNGTAPGSCHATDKALAVFYCLCSIGAQATFMLRCISVWENHPVVKAFLGVLLLVIVGSFVMFAVVIDGAKTGTGLLVCNINDPPRIEVIATISTAVIDIICIGLTTYRLRRKLNAGRIHQLLFRDGVIYLAIVVLVSGSLTGMLLTDLPGITRVVLSPVHLAVLSITATRAQRSLRSEGAKLVNASRSGGSNSLGTSGGPSAMTSPLQVKRQPLQPSHGDHLYSPRPQPHAMTDDETNYGYSEELKRSPAKMHPFELRKLSEEATQKLYGPGAGHGPQHERHGSASTTPWSTPSTDVEIGKSPRFF